jgi:spermidine synthase
MQNFVGRNVLAVSGSFLFKGRLTIFVSGFTMLMVQVVLLRELASLYAVNELIVGVFLAFWMLFAGLGAYVARFSRVFNWQHSGVFPLISGFAALLSVWLLYLVHEWLDHGEVAP